MNLVLVLAYNRPDYLDQCLTALKQCRRYDDYRKMISIDGGAPAETAEVAKAHGIDPVLLKGNYGIDCHNVMAISAAMFIHFDKVVVLEDDACLTPDALELADFYFNSLSDRYVFCSLGDPVYRKDPVYHQPCRSYLYESYSIYSAAWCLTRSSWEWMRQKWNRHLNTQLGWDWSLSYNLWESGRRSVYPLVSRCRNIGRQGVHSTPEHFDRNIKGARYSNGEPVEEFVVKSTLEDDSKGRLPPEWIAEELAAAEDRYGHLRNI